MKIGLIVPGGKKEISGMETVARPPLGVCYLKSFLQSKGHKAKVFHQVDETNSDLIKKILEYSPDLVGFSTMSYVFRNAVDIAQKLKEKNHSLKTVFGGEHITGCFNEEKNYGETGFFKKFCDRKGIDYYIPYEGELPIFGLVQGLEGKLNFDKIKGVIYRIGNEFKFNGAHNRISNLDILPIPDRSDLPYEKYCSVDEASDLEYMHTGRGCKFNCSYCSTPSSNPGKIAANSAERVVQEMKMLYEKYNKTNFFFADELFTYDPKRLEEICKRLETEGLNRRIRYRIFARVDDVTKGKINLNMLRNSGCNGLFFGIESMNNRTLKELRKGTNSKIISEAIDKTHESGIPVWGSLMMGYPWEEKNELIDSLKQYLIKVKEGKIFHTYTALITPFPGTYFHNQCRRNNWIIDNDNYLESDTQTPTLKVPFTKEELMEIYNWFRHETS